jgi:hypothetical protein
MAQIIINIPDDKLTEVRDALCEAYNYSTDSGLTKAQFAKKIVADFVKQIYINHVAEKSADTARKTSFSTTSNIDIN